MLLPITLVTAGGCAFINVWLSIRVSQLRHSEGVSIGDGGNERVTRRMRAHANFVENAPFILALIGLIEFAAGSSLWLWIASVAFLIARVLHGLGMDGGRLGYGRNIGTVSTLVLLIVLGIWALVLPYRATAGQPAPVEVAPPRV